MAKATQFLRFEDERGNLVVEGESFDLDHPGEVDVLGWNWSVKDPTAPPKALKAGAAAIPTIPVAKTPGEGQRHTGGNKYAKPDKLSFQKFTDRATTDLLQAMDNGTAIHQAVLTIEERFVRTEDEKLAESFHLEVILRDVLVVSFEWGVQAEDAGVTFNEKWELNYKTIHFKYRIRHTKGKGWMDQIFEQSPDAADSSTKSPPTAGEKQEFSDAQIADYLRRHPQRRAGEKQEFSDAQIADYLRRHPQRR